MSKIWDEREKGLEDEYIRHTDEILIEKLRAKRAAAEQAKSAEAAAPRCPKCDGSLVEIALEEVKIDRCNKCSGVWLDQGELERLTGQEKHWHSGFWKSLSG